MPDHETPSPVGRLPGYKGLPYRERPPLIERPRRHTTSRMPTEAEVRAARALAQQTAPTPGPQPAPPPD